jgi:hypothetical protein
VKEVEDDELGLTLRILGSGFEEAAVVEAALFRMLLS